MDLDSMFNTAGFNILLRDDMRISFIFSKLTSTKATPSAGVLSTTTIDCS
jgi:hypothetical protein